MLVGCGPPSLSNVSHIQRMLLPGINGSLRGCDNNIIIERMIRELCKAYSNFLEGKRESKNRLK